MNVHFKSLTEFHRLNGYPPPENPLLSLIRCTHECASGVTAYSGDFFMIGFKKMKAGVMLYGKTKYDSAGGGMYFTKPRQVIEMNDITLEEDGFAIYFHEDYLVGHSLHQEIKKYNYFDYEANEALHLSPHEEMTIRDLYSKIETEYYNNQDEYSKEIILGHIDTILKYSQRFYKRQFIHRTEMSGTIVSKFTQSLREYFESGQLTEKGLPTVAYMASSLHLSPRYLSDLLKQETGKTAIELIHISLISEAKNMLKGEDSTVAEIAYTLGFENLPYFSRLFKKETGISPVQFRKQILN